MLGRKKREEKMMRAAVASQNFDPELEELEELERMEAAERAATPETETGTAPSGAFDQEDTDLDALQKLDDGERGS